MSMNGGAYASSLARPGRDERARLPAAIVMLLIPWTVVSTIVLDSLATTFALAGVLTLAAGALFASGSFRPSRTHAWIGVMAAGVLLAYLVPQVRLAPPRQTLESAAWILAGLVILAVCVSAPPNPLVLLRLIVLTGAAGAIISTVQGSLLEGRLQGLGLNPNYLAVYLAPAVVIAVGLALGSRNPLWLLPGALCVPALLASQSREGLLALLVGLAFLLIQGRSLGLKVMTGLVALGGVIAFHASLASILSLGAGSRTVSDLANDNLVRDHVALFAMRVVIDHPLLGIGVGQFPSYAASIGGMGIYITTTNEYLLLAAETGLVCLTALLVLLWLAVKNARAGDLAVLRAAVVTTAVSMLFIDSFGSPVVIAPFWACLGVLLAFPRAVRWPAADPGQYPTVTRTEIAP
jgi:hypothetical protein